MYCGASNCSNLAVYEVTMLNRCVLNTKSYKSFLCALALIHKHAHLFSCSHSLSSSFTRFLASSCSPALLCSHEMIFSVYISVCQPLHTSLLLDKCCSANLREESHIFIFHLLLWRSLYVLYIQDPFISLSRCIWSTIRPVLGLGLQPLNS